VADLGFSRVFNVDRGSRVVNVVGSNGAGSPKMVRSLRGDASDARSIDDVGYRRGVPEHRRILKEREGVALL
jgi:hypothetical protein